MKTFWHSVSVPLAPGSPCFAAGTPIRTPQGQMPIEPLRAGDLVLSRDEQDPDGPLVLKRVEEVFVRRGVVFHLHVGQVIRTTPEHPYYVQHQGWTAAGELEIGDLLSTEAAGGWIPGMLSHQCPVAEHFRPVVGRRHDAETDPPIRAI